MNDINIFNNTDEKIVELLEVEKLIDYMLKIENLSNVIFSVIIVSDEEIKNINNQFRKVNKATDVISFALEDNQDIKFDNFRLLGDVYISIDTARKQSIEYNHSLLRELSFLTVHGILHLLGYDHMDELDEKVMLEKQELILNGYGIKK